VDEITSRVKRENYITIQGWMITDLNLKGNELQIYAIIYGFSQTEGQQFAGGLQYIADWINGTRRTALNCLQSLTEKGLISKNDTYINGIKNCQYRCIPLEALTGEKLSPGVVKNFHRGGEKDSPGVVKNFHRGGEKDSPNNIDNNLSQNIEKKKEDNDGAPAPAPSPTKQTKVSKEKVNTEEIFARYTQEEKVLSLLREWLKVRKAKRAPETEKALTLNLDKLEGLALQSGMNKAEYLEAVIARGWAAFYPLGDWNRPARMPARPPVKTEAQHAAGGHQSGFGW